MKKQLQQLIQQQRMQRIRRVRSRVHGTATAPRIAVNRSLHSFSAQAIDDTAGKTLFSVHQREVDAKGTPTEIAAALGTLLAEKAKKAGIEQIVFDRRSYRYHGRVKAFAEAARAAGLKF